MPGCNPGSVHEEEGENGHQAGTHGLCPGLSFLAPLCSTPRGGGHSAPSSALLPCWNQPLLVSLSLLLMGFIPLEWWLHHSQPLTPGRILRGALLCPKSVHCAPCSPWGVLNPWVLASFFHHWEGLTFPRSLGWSPHRYIKLLWKKDSWTEGHILSCCPR